MVEKQVSTFITSFMRFDICDIYESIKPLASSRYDSNASLIRNTSSSTSRRSVWVSESNCGTEP